MSLLCFADVTQLTEFWPGFEFVFLQQKPTKADFTLHKKDLELKAFDHHVWLKPTLSFLAHVDLEVERKAICMYNTHKCVLFRNGGPTGRSHLQLNICHNG